jgi:hypothetical protein
MPRQTQNISAREIRQIREDAVKLFSERETKGKPVDVRYEGNRLVLIYADETRE